MFNVESEAELEAIARVADESESAPMAMRVNPDVDPKTHRYISTGKKESKFGMDIDRSLALAEGSKGLPSVSMIGMHMHIGSQITTPRPYAGAVAKGVEIIAQLRAMGHPIAWYNMGGGFGINYKGHEAKPIAEFAKGDRAGGEGDRMPAGDGAGAGDRRERGHPGQPCVIYQAVGREAVPDSGRRDERPDPSGALRVVPPDLAGRCSRRLSRAAGRLRGCDRGSRALGRGRPGLRERRFPGQGPSFAAVSTAAALLAVFSAGAYGMVMASNYNTRPRAAEILVDGASAPAVSAAGR